MSTRLTLSAVKQFLTRLLLLCRLHVAAVLQPLWPEAEDMTAAGLVSDYEQVMPAGPAGAASADGVSTDRTFDANSMWPC
jgi:hypothetical protein